MHTAPYSQTIIIGNFVCELGSLYAGISIQRSAIIYGDWKCPCVAVQSFSIIEFYSSLNQ